MVDTEDAQIVEPIEATTSKETRDEVQTVPEKKVETELQFGDIKWDKNGSPPWPCIICDPGNIPKAGPLKSLLKKVSPTTYVVLYYGANNYSTTAKKNLLPYDDEHKTKYRTQPVAKKYINSFTNAIEAADGDLQRAREDRFSWFENRPVKSTGSEVDELEVLPSAGIGKDNVKGQKRGRTEKDGDGASELEGKKKKVKSSSDNEAKKGRSKLKQKPKSNFEAIRKSNSEESIDALQEKELGYFEEEEEEEEFDDEVEEDEAYEVEEKKNKKNESRGKKQESRSVKNEKKTKKRKKSIVINDDEDEEAEEEEAYISSSKKQKAVEQAKMDFTQETRIERVRRLILNLKSVTESSLPDEAKALKILAKLSDLNPTLNVVELQTTHAALAVAGLRKHSSEKIAEAARELRAFWIAESKKDTSTSTSAGSGQSVVTGEAIGNSGSEGVGSASSASSSQPLLPLQQVSSAPFSDSLPLPSSSIANERGEATELVRTKSFPAMSNSKPTGGHSSSQTQPFAAHAESLPSALKTSVIRMRSIRLLYDVLLNIEAALTLEASIYNSFIDKVKLYFESVTRFASTLRRQDRRVLKQRIVHISNTGAAEGLAVGDVTALSEIVKKTFEYVGNRPARTY